MAVNRDMLVTLDPELFDALKSAAAHKNTSMSAALRRALRRDLGLDATIDPAAPNPRAPRGPRTPRPRRPEPPTPPPEEAPVDDGIAIPLIRYTEDP